MIHKTAENKKIKIILVQIKELSTSVKLESDSENKAFVMLEEDEKTKIKNDYIVDVIVPIYDDFSNLTTLNFDEYNSHDEGDSYKIAIDIFQKKIPKGKIYLCYDGITTIDTELKKEAKVRSFYLHYQLSEKSKKPLSFSYYLLKFHYEILDEKEVAKTILMGTPSIDFDYKKGKLKPKTKRGTVTTPQASNKAIS